MIKKRGLLVLTTVLCFLFAAAPRAVLGAERLNGALSVQQAEAGGSFAVILQFQSDEPVSGFQGRLTYPKEYISGVTGSGFGEMDAFEIDSENGSIELGFTAAGPEGAAQVFCGRAVFVLQPNVPAGTEIAVKISLLEITDISQMVPEGFAPTEETLRLTVAGSAATAEPEPTQTPTQRPETPAPEKTPARTPQQSTPTAAPPEQSGSPLKSAAPSSTGALPTPGSTASAVPEETTAAGKETLPAGVSPTGSGEAVPYPTHDGSVSPGAFLFWLIVAVIIGIWIGIGIGYLMWGRRSRKGMFRNSRVIGYK